MRRQIASFSAIPSNSTIVIQEGLRGFYVVHDSRTEDTPFTARQLLSNMKELVVNLTLTTPSDSKKTVIDELPVFDLQYFASSLGKKAHVEKGKSVFYVPLAMGNIKLEGENSYLEMNLSHEDSNFAPFTIYADYAPVVSKTYFSYTKKNLQVNSKKNVNVLDMLAVLFKGSVEKVSRRFSNGTTVDNSYTELMDDSLMNGFIFGDEHTATTNKRLFPEELLLSLTDSMLNIKSLDLKVSKETHVVFAKENQYLI